MAEEQEELPQIFIKDGLPVLFALHDSIRSQGMIEAIIENIRARGGDILESDDGADVVLINSGRPGMDQQAFQRAYDTHPDPYKSRIFVRDLRFLRDSIRNGKLYLEAPAKKRMPGARAGAGRTLFTKEDEDHLCDYMATVTPDPQSGGRLGTAIYRELMNNASYTKDLPEWVWVARHTEQSWREHYKKNRERLDLRISDIVAQRPPNLKAQYFRDAKLNERGYLRTIEDFEQDDQMDIEADEAEEAGEQYYRGTLQPDPVDKGKRREVIPADAEDHEEEEEEREQEEHEEEGDLRAYQSQQRRAQDDTLNPPEPSLTLVNNDVSRLTQSRGKARGSTRQRAARRSASPVANDNAVDNQPQERSQSPSPTPAVQTEPANRRPRGRPKSSTRKRAAPTGAVASSSTQAPPFRNTRARSRSQSVSAEQAPAPPTKPSTRQRGQQTDVPTYDPAHEPLEPLLEIPADEEMRYESLISQEGEQPHQDSQPYDPVEGPSNVAEFRKRERESSQESDDDQQTRQKLRRHRPEVKTTPAQGRVGARKLASPTSETSSADIPARGTHASAKKKALLQQEKYNTPFSPMPGTRAAAQLRVRA